MRSNYCFIPGYNQTLIFIFTSRGTRWGEIFSVSDLYEIYDNNFN